MSSPSSPASSPASSRVVGTVAMRWHEHCLELLDQRLLPAEEHWLTLEGASGVAQSIRDMVVRGAPAIGISAAYGVALAAAMPGVATGKRKSCRQSASWRRPGQQR